MSIHTQPMKMSSEIISVRLIARATTQASNGPKITPFWMAMAAAVTATPSSRAAKLMVKLSLSMSTLREKIIHSRRRRFAPRRVGRAQRSPTSTLANCTGTVRIPAAQFKGATNAAGRGPRPLPPRPSNTPKCRAEAVGPAAPLSVRGRYAAGLRTRRTTNVCGR